VAAVVAVFRGFFTFTPNYWCYSY